MMRYAMFKVMLVAILSLWGNAFAQTVWTVSTPASQHPSQSEARILISIDYNALSESIRNDIGGISADMHYDADKFACPRVVPCASGRVATGYLLEPGVYRFTVYSSPVNEIMIPPMGTYDVASIYLPVITESSCVTQVSFTGASASKLNRESHGSITMAPIDIRLNYNAVKNWALYE